MYDQSEDATAHFRPLVEVRSSNGFNGVFAVQNVARGERLIPVEGAPVTIPSRYSIQIGRSQHIDAGEDNPPWKYMNHGCEPNAAFSAEERCFTAIRDIRSGEEIRFNYLTTEWEMAEPFDCRCGARGCFGWIAGFKHLDHASQMKLIESAAGYIKELFSEGVAAESG